MYTTRSNSGESAPSVKFPSTSYNLERKSRLTYYINKNKLTHLQQGKPTQTKKKERQNKKQTKDKNKGKVKALHFFIEIFYKHSLPP